MPIHDNVVFVREGGEKDGEEFESLFTRTSPRHPVVPYRLVLQIGEVVEPTIWFEIVTHVLEVRGTNIQNGPITHKDLDEELVSLHKFSMLELGNRNERNKLQMKMDEGQEEVPIQKN